MSDLLGAPGPQCREFVDARHVVRGDSVGKPVVVASNRRS